MRGLAGVMMAVLLVACGGASSEVVGSDPANDATTTTIVTGANATTDSTTDSSASTATDSTTAMSAAPSTSAALDSVDCLVGEYELDGAGLFAQVAAASGGGSGEIVGGSVVLELRADGAAVVEHREWTFRLSFPGESDTVLGTQNGTITGTWGVDEDAATYWIDLTQEAITVTFVLESANGPIPVPAGDALAPLGRTELLAVCPEPGAIIRTPDAQTGAVIAWTFWRIDA